MKNTGTTLSATTVICLFSLIVVCLACNKEKTMAAPPSNTNTTPVPPPKNIRLLALGDSYTIGESVRETDRFPAQTAQLLKVQGVTATTLQYIARTGWTTIGLKSAIETQKPATDFNIVTLLIGVNDQYQHMDTAGYRTRFEELLNIAIEHADKLKTHVFVLSIPDYSATPFVSAIDKERIQKEISAFNAINKQITLNYGISYVDITPSTRQALMDPSLVANDGLHPSAKEYRKWAEMLAPLITTALK